MSVHPMGESFQAVESAWLQKATMEWARDDHDPVKAFRWFLSDHWGIAHPPSKVQERPSTTYHGAASDASCPLRLETPRVPHTAGRVGDSRPPSRSSLWCQMVPSSTSGSQGTASRAADTASASVSYLLVE